MKIITNGFASGGQIPKEFTCDGGNKMFDLKVSEIPNYAKCLAIIIEDPDAPSGTYTHFLAWNIPALQGEVHCSDLASFPLTGKNTSGVNEYVAPCPPSGIHRYFIKFFALSELLSLGAGATRADLEKAMNGKIIQEAETFGVYSKR
jgi:hypothetical protein